MLHPLSSDELAKKIAADRIATQQDVEPITGESSLANPYISTTREHATYDLGLAWNMLDLMARDNSDCSMWRRSGARAKCNPSATTERP